MQNPDIDLIARLADQSAELLTQAPSQTNAEFHQSTQAWLQLLTDTTQGLGLTSKVSTIEAQFRLDKDAVAFLLYALLPAVNTHYSKFFSHFSKNNIESIPTAGLIQTLISTSIAAKNLLNSKLQNDSPLFYWPLLSKSDESPFENVQISPTQTLINHFNYQNPKESGLDGLIREVNSPELDLPFDKPAQEDPFKIICLEGSFVARRNSYAYKLARQQQQPLFILNDRLIADTETVENQFKEVLCFVALSNGILLWPNGINTLDKVPALTRTLFEWLKLNTTRLIFSVEQFDQVPQQLAQVEQKNIVLPALDNSQQELVWSITGNKLISANSIDFKSLNKTYNMWYPRVAQCLEKVAQGIQNAQPVSTSQVMQSYVATSPSKITNLANLDPTHYTFADMVLSPAVKKGVDQITQAYKNRAEISTGKDDGVLALFEGATGTGKTMTAECLATELGLPLYRVDYAQLPSLNQQTEKSLKELFTEASQNSALLLFDDAEVLIGKASGKEAANPLTTALVQSIQSYSGLVILTSASKLKIDNKLLHKSVITLSFPALKPPQQFQIFQKTLASLGVNIKDERALEQEINQLGANGTQIKNIVKNSILSAKPDNVPLSEIVIAAKDLAAAVRIEINKQKN